MGLLACCIFKNKKVEEKLEKPNLRDMFDFSIAKDGKFLLWCAADIVLEAAYNVPYYFLPCKIAFFKKKETHIDGIINNSFVAYATHLGLSSSQGAVILSAGSGMNAFGRIVSG